MAFITTAGFNTVAQKQNVLCKTAAVQRSSRKAVIRAARDLKEDTKFETIESNNLKKAAASDSAPLRPQGFTPYAEIINGRFAMLGFTLALLTEAISPAHPSLLQQLYTMIPIQPYVERLFH
uniref:Uncharacterized protein n=1 Tax=Erythrolobus australicus TaxID=1077150 RepID=A0A7S1TKM3_9RHOD|mmetsp:Transcript_1903/g.5037  ORF Transcript_1903/g.5037 Transcript_1903/m.5037 type:complete len:122 (+) Transcript_1903:446-811(+)